MGKVLSFGTEARTKMLKGIEELEKAVTTTLGPVGKTVLIYKGTSHPNITKDGVSVAREIKFSNHHKNAGASIVKEAAEKTNAIAGDGTTTTVLLASELCKEGMKLASLGYDVIEIQKGMDDACKDVLKELDKYKKTVSSDNDILSVATISANNDKEVGEVVKQAFTGIGDGGRVNIQDSHSKSGKTIVKFSNGFEIPKGIIDGRFVNDLKNDRYLASEPIIVLLSFIPKLNDCMDILNYAYKKSKPVIIIAPDFDEDLESLVVVQTTNKKLDAALVRAPGATLYTQEEQLKDLAVALDTKVYENVEQLKEIKDINENLFGKCETVKSTVYKTTFEGLSGTDEKIEARAKELSEELENRKNDIEVGLSEEEISIYKSRISRLTGGIATIYIGALTEVRFKELKDRFEDAVHAVEAAVSDGIVPGGGLALLKAARDVYKTIGKTSSISYEVGYKTLLDVCKKPADMIISSATRNYAYIIADIEHNNKVEYGYDAKKQEMCNDMFLEGIIDPIKVTKTALQYATDVAGVFLTTDCVITDEYEHISLTPHDPVTERLGDFNEF